MNYRFTMKTVLRRASELLTGISLLFLLSCNEEPTFLGRDLLPPSDDFFTRYYEGEVILTSSINGKAVSTGLNSTFLLGSYSDSIFGKVKADFAVRPEAFSKTLVGKMEIDSMVIHLAVDGYYGDTLSTQVLRVYELSDSMSVDSSYYTNEILEGKYEPAELGQAIINPLDSVVRIAITDVNLKERFENAPDSVYFDINDFVSFFNGFYLTTDDITDQGAIIYYSLASISTRFDIYYQDDTTGAKTMTMPLGNLTSIINSFQHDFSTSRVMDNFNNPDALDSRMYVEAMAGINTRLQFPEISTWLDSLPVAINNAELIIPVDTLSGIGKEFYPAKLLLSNYDENLDYNYIYDLRIDASGGYYDGTYDSEQAAYVFNIGAHLQSFIQNDGSSKMDLILSPSDNSKNAKRVVLFSPYNIEQPMKLKITYTRF